MVRASAAAEEAGVRSVSIITSGFARQAQAFAQAQGVEGLAIAEYPGVVLTDSQEEFDKKVNALVDQIAKGLAAPAEHAAKPSEPTPQDIVFEGTLKEVQEFFTERLWTDGLPIIPPTIEEVEGFLRFTDRSPNDVIAILPAENREATVWNIAVNGVMAGCRPEYMPVLVAAVEAIAKPEFRLEDAGSTPGWEPLVIVNGPIVKQLGFNCGAGVMRVGRQANTSIGRFLRLYMRNVAGFRAPPGVTDKASIGGTFNVALAENEDAVAETGWEPFSCDWGFKRGENVVTVQSVVAISPPTYTGGDKAEEHVETIINAIGNGTYAYWSHLAMLSGKCYLLLVMSPNVAKVIAKDGWTKDDIRKSLYDKVKVPAGLIEKYAWQTGPSSFSLCAQVAEGILPREYCESPDPDRLVRAFIRPEWIGIVLAGDPDKNQVKGYVNNHRQGFPVGNLVKLPAKWERLLTDSVGDSAR